MDATTSAPLPAPDAAATSSVRDRARGHVLAALNAMLDEYTSVIAGLRVGANGLLTAAAALLYAELGPHRLEIVVTRASCTVGAIAIFAAIAWRRSRPASGLGIVLDVTSLAAAGWHATLLARGLPPGGLLSLAGLALLSGIFVMAATPFALPPAIEALGLRIATSMTAEPDETSRRLEQVSRDSLAALARMEELGQLVVHDLKSPLTVILSSLSLVERSLERSPKLAAETEALQVAADEVQWLARMVEDLLVIPRLERGELRGRFCTVGVRSLLETVARGRGPQASSRNVQLRVVAPSELVAWLDPELVRRLLENLLSNAFRFVSNGGRIELAAEVCGGGLRLAVRNDGPPIPVGHRPHLFEKYGAHGPGRSRSGGLGLYLCRLVTLAHGGAIALVERDGWSVSFEAELPIAGCSAVERQPSPRPRSAFLS